MLSRNNIELSVGQDVLVLQVPIVGSHEFVDAKVVRLTTKQVVVEYQHRDRWGANGLREFKRYPEQVFVI